MPRIHQNLEDLIRFTIKKGVHIDFLVQYDGFENNIEFKNKDKLKILFRNTDKKLSETKIEEISIPNIFDVLRKIKTGEYDLIVYRGVALHSMFWYILYAMIVAVYCKIKSKNMIRYEQIAIVNFETISLNWLAKFFSLFPNFILGQKVVSPIGRDNWFGIHLIRFSALICKPSQFQRKKIRFVIVGKYGEIRKNHEKTLSLLSKLAETSGVKIECFLCGNSNNSQENIAKKIPSFHNINIHIKINLSRRELRNIYKMSTFFLLMSENEQAAYSPIEAAYSGCIPVLLQKTKFENPTVNYFDENEAIIFRNFEDQIAFEKLRVAFESNEVRELYKRNLEIKSRNYRIKDMYKNILSFE